MRERPILFSAPMVRALLDGQKTQTRRVVKLAPPTDADEVFFWSGEDLRRAGWPNVSEPGMWARRNGREGYIQHIGRCPYGVPGDRLWVRETHLIYDAHGQHRADGNRWGPWGGLPTRLSEDRTKIAYFREGFDRCDPGHWRPSIHMPRWASRLTLEITEVRVERLQDISEADAIAEGATPRAVEGAVGGQRWCMDWSRVGSVAFGTTRIRPQDIGLYDPQMAFANYINQLHGGPRWNFYYNGDARYPKPIWDVNPWVWAITLRVLP